MSSGFTLIIGLVGVNTSYRSVRVFDFHLSLQEPELEQYYRSGYYWLSGKSTTRFILLLWIPSVVAALDRPSSTVS